MSEPEVSIRRALLDDLPGMVQVNARAFEGTLGASLGRRYQSAFVGWFLERSDSICLVADAGDTIAGCVYGAPDGYDATLKRDLRSVTALELMRHPSAMLHPNFLRHLRGRAREAILGTTPYAARPTAPAPVFDLVGIGTDPARRQRGLGRRLLTAFFEQAFERGFASVILDVYAHNAAAVRLYESGGFEVLWADGPIRRYQLARDRHLAEHRVGE